MSDWGIAAQFTLTKGHERRGEAAWMARAISSLPVPVSPVISTVESIGATFVTCHSTVRSGSDEPTISSNSVSVPRAALDVALPSLVAVATFVVFITSSASLDDARLRAYQFVELSSLRERRA